MRRTNWSLCTDFVHRAAKAIPKSSDQPCNCVFTGSGIDLAMARPWRGGVCAARRIEWCVVQTMNGCSSLVIRWSAGSIGPAPRAGYLSEPALSPLQKKQACHNGNPEGHAHNNDEAQRLPHRPFWRSALTFVVRDSGRRLLVRCSVVFSHRTTLIISAIRNRQPPLLRPESCDLTCIAALASFFSQVGFRNNIHPSLYAHTLHQCASGG